MRFVYLIDEDPSVRRLISQLLGVQRGLVVRAFRTGAAFLAVADTLDPGVVLLELQTPRIDGTAILEALRAAGEGRFVGVLVTGVETIPLVVRAMKAGAADLVTKPFDDDNLLAAMEAAFSRLDAEQAELLAGKTAREKILHLSCRERDVLRGLVDGRANKVIAGNLGISPRTVEIYRANVMRKLGVRSLAEGIRLVFAARWGLDEPAPAPLPARVSVPVPVVRADGWKVGFADPVSAIPRNRPRPLQGGQGHISIVTPIIMGNAAALTAHR